MGPRSVRPSGSLAHAKYIWSCTGSRGCPQEKRLPPESPIRRVLIYRLGSLGDTVVALPCFHLIARTFPQAERFLLTNFPVHTKAPAAAAVLGDSGLVHSYMRYTAGTRRVDELLRLAWEIRRFRPDLLVYLMPMRPWKDLQRDQMFFRMAGVRKMGGLPGEQDAERRVDAGTGAYEPEALRPGRGFSEPEALRMGGMMSELGDVNAGDPANWSLHLTDAERAVARAALGAL